MFLSAKNLNVIESKFEHGIGRGGSLKIVDTDKLMNEKLRLQSEYDQGSVLISGCLFDKDELGKLEIDKIISIKQYNES